MNKTYIVDITSVYGVDEKTADNLQVRPDSLNQEWLIDQVKKGAIYVCDIIQEDGFEHTGESRLNFLDLNNESDVLIYDKIVSGETACQRCQFEGETTKCPMFKLAEDPANDQECATASWQGFKSFCELLPVEGDTDE